MATNNNIVRISIFEENELVLKICNVLNALANPTEKNGFKFNISNRRLIISVYRCRNSYAAFEELTCERSSCILPLRKPFPELIMIIDIFNSVKMKKILTVNKKVLHISAIGRTTTISAKMHIVHADSSSGVAFFCSKFNYLSAQGIATFQFNVLCLSSNSPELLEITIIPPSDKEQKSKYDATMELISSISQFNS